jgi:hypothetical protein
VPGKVFSCFGESIEELSNVFPGKMGKGLIFIGFRVILIIVTGLSHSKLEEIMKTFLLGLFTLLTKSSQRIIIKLCRKKKNSIMNRENQQDD